MSAYNQKPPSPPKFSSEHEEADWWASPAGRGFLENQPLQAGMESGHGSKLVAQFAQANSVQATPAEPAVRAEAEAKAQLKASFNRFVNENDPSMKKEEGRDLIRSIFGDDATAGPGDRRMPRADAHRRRGRG